MRSDERRGESIGARYVVEGELGRGGMATVYLARDGTSGRQVAIKMLLPELGAALGPERFRREIAIERELDHPNILGILDWGESEDGQLYYVMPYVAGESLRARLDRDGQLPVEDAIRIAVQVARGLAYAHERGILHRDVKPENVLLDGDRALVADFGIARALSRDTEQRLTQTGVTLGTPRYMSPEQSMAERDLDGRSDLYSLGCVLYEMLTGQPPFTGANAHAIMARHHLEAVPSIAVVRPTVSDGVEDIVMRALAKSPSDRHPGVTAFADALDHCLATGCATVRRSVATSRYTTAVPAPPRRRVRLALGLTAAVALAATLGGAFAWRAQDAEGRAVQGVLAENGRVAVLYFRDASPGGRLGYLADALTETLIDELARAGVDVVSRNGVLPFRGGTATRDSIAAALGSMGLLVDGTVEERDGQARLSLMLVDPRSDAVLSTRAFDLPVAGAEGGSLAGQLRPVEEFLRSSIGREVSLRASREAAGNDEAWTLVQRAHGARKRADERWQAGDTAGTTRSLGEADSLAARAASLAPRWTQPPVLRGQLAHYRTRMLRDPAAVRPWLDAALAHAGAALAMDPAQPDALELRGAATYDRVRMGVVTDAAGVRELVDAAERDLRRAAESSTGSAEAWVRLSEVNYRKLNVLEANRAAQRAYERDAYLTSAPTVLWRLFVTSYDLNQPQDAAGWCATGGERFPNDARFVRCRLMLMSMQGAEPDAALAWSLLDELEARTPPPERAYRTRLDRIYVAAALARAGLADSARTVLLAARADRRADPRGELRGYEAFARLIVGDRDEALALLQAYLRDNPEHREGFGKINAWWWQDLKREPRFQQLLLARD